MLLLKNEFSTKLNEFLNKQLNSQHMYQNCENKSIFVSLNK